MTDSRNNGAGPRPRRPSAHERPRHQHTEPERNKLIHDPNLNQAGNDRGSLDQTQGSQTGNDIDTVPEP